MKGCDGGAERIALMKWWGGVSDREKGKCTLNACVCCCGGTLPRHCEHPGLEPAQTLRPHLPSLCLSSTRARAGRTPCCSSCVLLLRCSRVVPAVRRVIVGRSRRGRKQEMLPPLPKLPRIASPLHALKAIENLKRVKREVRCWSEAWVYCPSSPSSILSPMTDASKFLVAAWSAR